MSVLLADTAALLFLIRHPKPKFVPHSRHGLEVTGLKKFSKFEFGIHIFFKHVFWVILAYPDVQLWQCYKAITLNISLFTLNDHLHMNFIKYSHNQSILNNITVLNVKGSLIQQTENHLADSVQAGFYLSENIILNNKYWWVKLYWFNQTQ